MTKKNTADALLVNLEQLIQELPAHIRDREDHQELLRNPYLTFSNLGGKRIRPFGWGLLAYGTLSSNPELSSSSALAIEVFH